MGRKLARRLGTQYDVATDVGIVRKKPGRKVPTDFTCICIAPVLDGLGECNECGRVPLSYLLDRVQRRKESMQ